MIKGASILFIVVLCAFGASRDGYRNAYREWRALDPTLERDAGSAESGTAARAYKMADAAAKYGSERSVFLQMLAGESEQNLTWLETPASEPPMEMSKGVADQMAAEASAIQRGIASYANDPEEWIQQLEALLQIENATLASLRTAMSDRQQTIQAVKTATAAIELARKKALSQERELISGLKEAAADSDLQTAAWVEYYKTFPEDPRGGSPAPTSAPPAISITTPAVPSLRYTGAWKFPTHGLVRGPQAESIEMVVREENGHATGTLFARFKMADWSKDDPVLRFHFAGDFKSAPNQVFTLQTSDGASGTIELIAGPASNLLDVSFQIEPKPGRTGLWAAGIRQAYVVLVKK
jgi:hypothetical protein